MLAILGLALVLQALYSNIVSKQFHEFKFIFWITLYVDLHEPEGQFTTIFTTT